MGELLPQIIFFVFAGLTVISACLVITQNNPVRCVLFLVLAFSLAPLVLWILVQAEFLALVLVLVYVGAVMTLFLFVVMMLNIDIESMKKHFLRHLPLGLGIIILLTGLLYVAIPLGDYTTSEKYPAVETLATTTVVTKPESNTVALGMVLYTDYVLAFELAAVILLVSIIAAITLVHRSPIRTKQQNIVQQIMTRKHDRVTLIKMKSEK